jgi:hypothetical protein
MVQRSPHMLHLLYKVCSSVVPNLGCEVYMSPVLTDRALLPEERLHIYRSC